MEALTAYLHPTQYLDSDHPEVVAFAQKAAQGAHGQVAQAQAVYYAVRDRWAYEAVRYTFKDDEMKASALLGHKTGHCLEKGVFMTACCRALRIPARLCLAKVKNHISAENVKKMLGTDVLVPHCYVEVWLAGKWVKATPAFDKGLCDKLGVHTLDFDGQNDSLFQAFSRTGDTFMEYLEEYGHFDDLPVGLIIDLLKSHYPKLVNMGYPVEKGASFMLQ